MAQRPMAAARAMAMVGAFLLEVSAVRPSAAASISSTVMGGEVSASSLRDANDALLLIFNFFRWGRIWDRSSSFEPMAHHCSVVAS